MLTFYSDDVCTFNTTKKTLAKVWARLTPKSAERWYSEMRLHKVDWKEIHQAEFPEYVFIFIAYTYVT